MLSDAQDPAFLSHARASLCARQSGGREEVPEAAGGVESGCPLDEAHDLRLIERPARCRRSIDVDDTWPDLAVENIWAELLKVPALRKDGSRISLEFSIALVRDEDDRVPGAAAIIRDVTARWHEEKALRERLAASEAQLAAAGLEQP